MPQVEEGDRVRLRYACKLEDGTVYDVSDDDTLEFVVGEGDVFLALEKAALGMEPGETKRLRIPAEEVMSFPFVPSGAPNDRHFPSGLTDGIDEQYNIGPGEEGDQGLEIGADRLRIERADHAVPSQGEELIFEIELLSIERDGELQLGDE